MSAGVGMGGEPRGTNERAEAAVLAGFWWRERVNGRGGSPGVAVASIASSAESVGAEAGAGVVWAVWRDASGRPERVDGMAVAAAAAGMRPLRVCRGGIPCSLDIA